MLEVSASTGRLSRSSATAYQPLSGSQKAWLNARLSRAAAALPVPGAGGVACLPGERGAGPVGGVGVALHLGQGDGRLGDRAVGEVDAVPGILPALVDQAGRGLAGVFDEPVAVGVAVPLHPLQGAVGVGQQVPGELGRGGPTAAARRAA